MRVGTDFALTRQIMERHAARLTLEGRAFLDHKSTELDVGKTARGQWLLRNGVTHQHMIAAQVPTGDLSDVRIRETFGEGWRSAIKQEPKV